MNGYWLSKEAAFRVGGIDRYVIAAAGRAIAERRSSGQTTYMTYKTLSRAERGLRRVLASNASFELLVGGDTPSPVTPLIFDKFPNLPARRT